MLEVVIEDQQGRMTGDHLLQRVHESTKEPEAKEFNKLGKEIFKGMNLEMKITYALTFIVPKSFLAPSKPES